MNKCISVKPTKVAIVGAGWVGSSAAFAMMLDSTVSEIALIDKNKDKAEGHALDLMHGMQFTRSTKITASDSFELVADAQIVILSAGLPQKPGQTRAELLDKNVEIFKNIVPQIVKYNKDCILLVVTNPLDILTYVTYKLSGFDPCKVFGTGTVLDTSRLRFLMGEKLGISPKDITAYILGEHGDSQFVWWSHANIAGIPIAECEGCSSAELHKLYLLVKNSVYEVIKKKGATYYAIAVVISKIVRAILTNQARVFTVSSLLENYLGTNDVCLSIPSVIKKDGICKQMKIDLNVEETKLFDLSVKKIKQEIIKANSLLS